MSSGKAHRLLNGTSIPVNPSERFPRTLRVAADHCGLEICSSPAMNEVLRLARRAAVGDAEGPHDGRERRRQGSRRPRRSTRIDSRSRGPFVAVNCAGLTETLLESELFGHVKGSFTGAYRDKIGKLAAGRPRHALPRRSRRDEPADAGAAAAIPRSRASCSASAPTSARVRVDVRVVAATNRNLAERVAAGEFREDLLYRLRVIHIHVPPLRERRADIRPLVEHFARRAPTRRPTSRRRRSSCSSGIAGPATSASSRTSSSTPIWHVGRPTRSAPESLPPCVRVTRAAACRRRSAAARSPTICTMRSSTAAARSGRTSTRCSSPATSRVTTSGSWCAAGCARRAAATAGLLTLFGMSPQDYQRFHNFLAAHECKVDYREFRTGGPAPEPVRRAVLPALTPAEPERAVASR